MNRLKGKVALITGAAGGMGELGSAVLFIRHGVTDAAQWASVIKQGERGAGEAGAKALLTAEPNPAEEAWQDKAGKADRPPDGNQVVVGVLWDSVMLRAAQS